MKDRSQAILSLLAEEHKVDVSALAEQLQVSQVTIRKDLDELERRGIVVREHGFARLCSPDNIACRIAYHYEEKRRIAARAAELVSDGETLMIENGSCCALLAEVLTQTKKDLTILTNSVFIADYIRNQTNFQIILLGGIYQPHSQVLVGPMVRQGAENFYVPHFFLGTDGYSPRTGFTNRDPMRAQAVRDMAHQADQLIVLTESEKFAHPAAVPLNVTNPIKTVITDHKLPSALCTQLQTSGISPILV